MSPDDVFAAQFWPWPDAAIKRDAQGRVLFVNAAFLSLYGGSVEAWRGNLVDGWPAPQALGRFETRMPSADGTHEEVYDWIEMTLSDGCAFALARNVTVFAQPPEPDPGQTHIPEAPAETSYTSAPATEPVLDAIQDSPPFEPAIAEQEAAPAAEPMAASVPDYPLPEVDIPETPMPPLPDVEEPAAVSETAISEVEVPEAPQERPVERLLQPDREVERRALPIENNDAVLGNNWRDAVIAKAVGSDTTTAAAQDETPEPAPAPMAQSDNGPIRILLAEDNAINALLTRTLLEAEGHTVETVEDGLLAVEAMKVGQYDLIFMDMRMPNMDGLEATRKIRTLSHVPRDLPIVALTANAFDDDRNACFDSGMNDFMTKPVSAEELSEMVDRWTTQREQKMAS